MKAKSVLDKQIFFESIFGFILLGVILVGGYVIYNSINGNSLFSKGDLLVDLKDDDVPNNLYAMSDGVGLKTKPYVYSVTNNNKKTTKIAVILENNIKSNSSIDNYLRIAIDDVTIKSLNEFKKNDKGNYIIYEEELVKGATSSHSIKIWLSSKSPNGLSGVAADFKFDLEEK